SLIALARDAINLMRMAGSVIQDATPHLYISVLPFLPKNSALRQQRIKYSKQGTKVIKGLEDQWPALELIIHEDQQINSVEFSPDGQKVVSGSDDVMIRIWNADTGELITGPLEGHSGQVHSVSFSSDGQRIVSGSIDQTIRIWNAHTGELITGPLEGHSGWVKSVSFSSDGQRIRIVSGSHDWTIMIWDANPHPEHIAFSPNPKHCINIPNITHNSQQKMDYNNVYFNKWTGWICGPQKELLFWIPPSYRKGLHLPRYKASMGLKAVTLDLSQLPHGTSWTDCWNENLD
ncbi:hypothetical protein M422DRAFT_167727, partial [Sphaerobolus stellatus SS14]